MPSRHRGRGAARISIQALELAIAAPQVMAYRLATMALAGASPTARDRREFHRMGVEKIAAFYESWNAMFLALLRANLNLAVTPFQFWWSLHRRRRTGLAILGASLDPIHRRVTANARRLRRRRIA